MTYRVEAGGILAASEALADRTRKTYSRAEVAYFLALAYASGRKQLHFEEFWDCAPLAQRPDPAEIRRRRIAQRLAEYERLAGPPRYRGGPVRWTCGPEAGA